MVLHDLSHLCCAPVLDRCHLKVYAYRQGSDRELVTVLSRPAMSEQLRAQIINCRCELAHRHAYVYMRAQKEQLSRGQAHLARSQLVRLFNAMVILLLSLAM